jgi:hypothetical protein
VNYGVFSREVALGTFQLFLVYGLPNLFHRLLSPFTPLRELTGIDLLENTSAFSELNQEIANAWLQLEPMDFHRYE